MTYYPPCQHLVPKRSSFLQREQNAACSPKTQNHSHKTKRCTEELVCSKNSTWVHSLLQTYLFTWWKLQLGHSLWSVSTITVKIEFICRVFSTESSHQSEFSQAFIWSSVKLAEEDEFCLPSKFSYTSHNSRLVSLPSINHATVNLLCDSKQPVLVQQALFVAHSFPFFLGWAWSHIVLLLTS